MNSEAIEADDATSRQAGRRLQLVHTGSSQFAIFAEDISAIVDWQEPAPLPGAPSSVLGVVSIQGRMLTVLDLSTLLDLDLASSDTSLKARGYLVALRGDEQLALAIEAPGEVVELAPNESTADLSANQEGLPTPVLGVMQREGAEIKILNLRGLFSTAIQGSQRRQRQF